MRNPFRSGRDTKEEPSEGRSRPAATLDTTHYLRVQGMGASRWDVLGPPPLPQDLLVLDERHGIELEPYPTWSSPPLPAPVTTTWPWPAKRAADSSDEG